MLTKHSTNKNLEIGAITDGIKTFSLSKSRNKEIEQIEHDIINLKQRIKGKEDRATFDHVLDPRTRSILSSLMKSDKIAELNGCFSTGKEASVYHAVDPNSQHLAIKIFKTAILDFKDRSRYIDGEFRFKNFSKKSTRQMVKLQAEKEFRNLKRLHSCGILCPEPLLLRKHVLVMEFIGDEYSNAPRLKDSNLTEDEANKCYQEIVKDMRVIYQKCKLVHGDLSEYNILQHNQKHQIIDVGQAVQLDHPRAYEFLLVDCNNVNAFFRKKNVLLLTIKEIFDFIVNTEIEDSDQYLNKLKNVAEKRDLQDLRQEIEDCDEREMKFQQFVPRSLFEVEDLYDINKLEKRSIIAIQKMINEDQKNNNVERIEEANNINDQERDYDIESNSDFSSEEGEDNSSEECLDSNEEKRQISSMSIEKQKKNLERKQQIKLERKLNKKIVKEAQRERRLNKVPKKVKKRREKLIKNHHKRK